MKGLWFITGLVLASFTCPAFAQEARQPWDEYDKKIGSAKTIGTLGPDLLGDRVDFQNGGLSLTATDVSLPGNNALEVAVRRTFTVSNRKGYVVNDAAFGDWELDLPRISGVFQAGGTGFGSPCVATTIGQGLPPAISVDGNTFAPDEYWNGNQLIMPGGGGGELMLANQGLTQPSTGGPYHWVTSGFTYVSCLPALQNGSGQGFLAITPDGTKYWFDWLAQYFEPRIEQVTATASAESIFGPAQAKATLHRSRKVLYATRVEDRFGNTVVYSYNNLATQPVRLTGILASDGRQITIDHNIQGQIDQVDDGNGHVWTYQYATPLAHRPTLTTVIQPDARRWTIDFSAFTQAMIRYEKGPPGEPVRSCSDPGSVISTGATGTITHPSGATGEFTVEPVRHGRSNVPMVCAGFTLPYNNVNDDVAYYTLNYDSLSLIRKRITGPGLAPAEWNYGYGATISFAEGTGPVCYNGTCMAPICIADSCAGTDATVVLGPGGEWTRYTFGNSYRYNEGKLLRVERGTGPADIRKTSQTGYELTLFGQSYPNPIATSTRGRGDGFTSEYLRPQKTSAMTQDGATFSATVTGFDGFARPLSVFKQSTGMAANYSRTDSTIYYDHLSKWIIGQVAQSKVNGTVASQIDFDAYAMPWKTYAFGRLQQTLTYNTDGTLKTFADGNNKVTDLSSWYRGVPREVLYPATIDQPVRVKQTAVVDGNGWITSVTDENTYQTCYTYDVMGRLTGMTPPSETASTCDTTQTHWNKTTQAFAPDGAAVYGLPLNHWQQAVTTGNAKKITHLDALWRPVVEESYDAADVANTRSLIVKRYDTSGHLVFQSYPLRTLTDYAAVTSGTTTQYDPLDRVTSLQQTSELGTLTTTTEYLTGFKTRVKSPRGQTTGAATTTSYMAFGQPTTDWPVAITHPAGAYTDIVRDVYGKPLLLTRRNAGSTELKSHYFAYDAFQQLCKRSEVETGTNAFGYDNAGNLIWSAAGLSWSPVGACEHTAASVAARRVDRTYDARNRLKTLRFPDHRGDQDWEYTPDNLPARVFTVNDPAFNNPINLYAYNHRRLLTTETLALPAWYTYSLGTTYDANGSLASQTYPSSRTVTYASNALGQPTQAKDLSPGGASYASAISYYANGAIKQFTYGNNVLHAMQQNARQLPSNSSDGSVSNLGYTYDANGNVATITDAVQANHHRALQYDDLERLVQAVSPMFGPAPALYAYDTLDNLTRVKTNGRDTYYCYNANHQLDFVRTGPNCTGSPTTTALTYDVQGNLSSKNAQGFDFDFGNRLRQAIGLEKYRYDAAGRRILANRLTGPAGTTGVIFSQYGQTGQLLYQENTRTAVNKQTDHIYLGNSLIAQREVPIGGGAAVVKYQHTDALGSPIAVTSSTGVVLERMDYEAYGKRIGGVSKDGPGYTGHVLDLATGLIQAQQRYLDPEIGRFLSVDPVSANPNTGSNFNRYWYADNNPYKNRDPDGRATCANPDCSKSYIDERPMAKAGPPSVNGSEGISEGAARSQQMKMGAAGPTITLQNDDPNGASPNKPISSSTAKMVEAAVIKSGAKSININSTTGGVHGVNSAHSKGRAVDINRVDSQKVNPSNVGAAQVQTAARGESVRENFGPTIMEKTTVPGSPATPFGSQALIEDHQDHIHLSGQQ